jgi:hypothetical protein
VQGPLVSKGADVTPEIIQKALQGDPAISGQNFVSLPAVQRYVRKEDGFIFASRVAEYDYDFSGVGFE